MIFNMLPHLLFLSHSFSFMCISILLFPLSFLLLWITYNSKPDIFHERGNYKKSKSEMFWENQKFSHPLYTTFIFLRPWLMETWSQVRAPVLAEILPAPSCMHLLLDLAQHALPPGGQRVGSPRTPSGHSPAWSCISVILVCHFPEQTSSFSLQIFTQIFIPAPPLTWPTSTHPWSLNLYFIPPGKAFLWTPNFLPPHHPHAWVLLYVFTLPYMFFT